MGSIQRDLTRDGKLSLEVREQMGLSEGEGIYRQIMQDKVGGYG